MVKEHKTVFGKYILDSLTRSMYENSKIIYRELIQNGADAIDHAVEKGFLKDRAEGEIFITIDKSERKITIEDNGIGIKTNETLPKLMNIGDSDKDKETDKGSRGYGRLAALGYCETLIIETSYQGETVKNIVSWSAKELMECLDNKKKEDAAELFQRFVNRTEENETADLHYFKVILENVNDESLLEKQEIRDYLSMVAPVPFDGHFLLKDKIYDYVKKHLFSLDEYRIYLNTDQLCKPYTTIIYEGNENNKERIDEISNIEFFYLPQNNPLLWGWYGVSSLKQQIPEKGNLARGLRLRKGNIQIGNSHCLVKLHKEPRGNLYFVGEVHALHSSLDPNSQRDYFVKNDITKSFEELLRHFFHDELYNLYYFSSKLRSYQNQIEQFVKSNEKYEQKLQKGFKDKQEVQQDQKRLEELKNKAAKAEKSIERIASELPKEQSPKRRIFEKIIKIKKLEIEDIKPPVIPEGKKVKYWVDELTKLKKEERKLVARVFSVVDKCLPDKDVIENIRLKIIEEFK